MFLHLLYPADEQIYKSEDAFYDSFCIVPKTVGIISKKLYFYDLNIKNKVMKRKFILIVLFCFPCFVLAQLHDDFSDGSFISNPSWIGDTTKFRIENGILRLNDSQPGQAYLSTASSLIDDACWEFWIRLAFSPTSSNHPRIYIVSDSPNLQGPLNGYFIRIGKDGSDNKRIYFFRQDGEVLTELLSGSMNLATGTNNVMRIRVIRDSSGNWQILADPAGGKTFLAQGAVMDNTHQNTEWFGINCIYTVTNATRFYFDDFYAGKTIPEDAPLQVDMVKAVSASSLEIHFNRAVDQVSARNIYHYEIIGGVGNPLIASTEPANPHIVTLIFASHFSTNQLYKLRINHVADLQGNLLEEVVREFVFHQPSRFDVVFNELMVDPVPVVGLPAYEYIELFNTTGQPVCLEGWELQYSTTRRVLPAAGIPARGYLLLVGEAAYPYLESFGNVLAVPGLSPTALVNSGTTLMLYDQHGNLISWVTYSPKWYQDPSRSQGGWSLEKIDPDNFCQEQQNWRASSDPRGGTPAAANSVLGVNPDKERPYVLRAGYEDVQKITLVFSEAMDEASVSHPEGYRIYPLPPDKNWEPHPLSAHALAPGFSRVELLIGQPLQQGVHYEIQANTSMKDCAANSLGKNTARVAVPQPADSLDLLINEVLFNPGKGGARYVELFNRTQGKVIDLKEHVISSLDTLGNYLTSIRPISSESVLFFPGTYMVLTPDPEIVKKQYMTPNPDGFIITENLPGMTNTGGIVVIADRSLRIQDMLVFHEDMHSPLLSARSGVSLERLNPDRPTGDPSNWHSAARAAGFGTPGFRNSQFSPNLQAQKDPVELYPKVFSPDGDGQDDILQLSYSFDIPGRIANIRIFDSRGRMIRFLKKGELLATQGVITWDGTTDDKAKAAMGIYLIHLEVFDESGQADHYQKTAVLTRSSR